MNILTFDKASFKYKKIIFAWLMEKHVQEFWDNTQDHKDDIINFMEGRNLPSSYADGKFIYWIAFCDGEPYAMLMTIQETHKEDIDELKLANLSKTGNSYNIDYMIGNTKYLGMGYGTRTLIEFITFLRDSFDKKADTFLIDPATDNPRAKHVYEKAGFKYIDDFIMKGNCSGANNPHHLLVKKFDPSIYLEQATLKQYPIIQNMARFYVYDLSKECGHLSDDWELPRDGMFESFDFRKYFEDKDHKAYLVKIYEHIAGFVLLNKFTVDNSSDWNIGEFFILGKYQRKGIGKQVALKTWQIYKGTWEVSVIPENKPAIKFWEATISGYTKNNFTKSVQLVDFDKNQPRRIIFTFSND